MATVAVVDDDGSLVRLVTHWLEREGHLVRGYHSGAEGAAGVLGEGADVVLLDLELGDTDGLAVLDQLRTGAPHASVVMMTATGEVPSVVEAMRRGAFDYLVKPVARTKLVTTVRNAAERTRLQSVERQLTRAQQGTGYGGMLGTSPAMSALVRRLERVAPTDVTVLVRGESGTGKELVAQALHAQSKRRAQPFVAINCAAIPASLQESELFGHEKGAFTGADQQRAGRFEQARGGTLFLDEIAELSSALQASLLRVLQERVLYRVGGNEEIRVDVRVVAASHRDLGELVQAGHFREDLYYRLAVFEVETPPLRDRGADVLQLAEHFLAEACSDMGRSCPNLGMATRERLTTYRWPGNVRELRNAMRSVAVVADDVVRTEDLPRRLRQGEEASVPAEAPGATDDLSPMQRIERQAICEALDRHDGNVSQVIRELGVPRTTLYRKLRRYGLR